jgi:Catalytic LigB subunit of aromatic ring-opening dioxygenase
LGQVLGLGISHYPLFSGRDSDMSAILRMRLNDPDVPPHIKDPGNWPALMQAEWSNDQGTKAAGVHRQQMLVGLRKAREALDAFQPDIVVIWGDDQYENFKEDIVPAFCVLAYEDMTVKPFAQAHESAMLRERPNVWNEPADRSFNIRCHREAGKYLARELLGADFDVAYAYRPLHHEGLSHAFLNAVLYLDYDRRGFDYPIVPMQINCYGEQVISYKGFVSNFADRGRPLDPPSPSPKRCFDFGAAVARACRASPWRVALIASSSWSHAFLVDKTWRMEPDIAEDRLLYEAMVAGDYATWRNRKLAQINEAGQQEMLNWFALLGAMNALGQRCEWSDFVETYVFNSSKVAAIFPPAGA